MMSKPRGNGRKGEERERLLAVLANPVQPGGIGPRVVQAPGNLLAVDPAEYRCSLLAMQLADEWTEYVAATAITVHAQNYRQAIDRLCQYVDEALAPGAEGASLTDPDLFDTLVKWEFSLPEDYAPGSNRPYLIASCLRVLIVRRDDYPDREVAPALARLARGPGLLGCGEWTERDEFTRQEKRAMIRAAWKSVHATRRRLDDGWALAQRGRHPEQGSWTSVPDLLWGLTHEEIAFDDFRHFMPSSREWPLELLEFTAGPGMVPHPQAARMQLTRRLFASLYPTTLDLHAFRVLLMDATGYTSEEVTSFGEADMELLPRGVRLTLLKNRAGQLRHRAFRDRTPSDALPAEDDADGQLTVNWPRREASEVVRQLLDLTARVRAKTPHVTDTLFVSAAVRPNYRTVFDRWQPTASRLRFRDWLAAMEVEVKGAPHIGRLRKSVKVEKAIVTEGRIDAAADDHTEETFASHYAQGITLRIMSGRTIASAQQHWFDKALDRADGPTVVADTEEIGQGLLEDSGLSAQEAEDIMTGQLDTGSMASARAT